MASSNNSFLSSTDTVLNACSLEVLRDFEDDDSIPLVIGCYQLQDTNDDDTSNNNKQERYGQLRLYNIDKRELKFRDDPSIVEFKNEGVLDGKWMPCERVDDDDPEETTESLSSLRNDYIYASASSLGRIHLHKLVNNNSCLQLKHMTATELSSSDDAEKNCICLALDWDNNYSCNDQTRRLVSSYSDGSLAVHQINLSSSRNSDYQIEEIERWGAHNLFGNPSEVWTCCWAGPKTGGPQRYPETVLSGADDCQLKGWDLRLSLERPTFATKNTHEGGVTAFCWHPSHEHYFVSGSYDDHVRLWDIRQMKCPLAEVKCAGGIWRLRWHQHDHSKILVGAMHGGCAILNADNLENNNSIEFSVGIEFTCHESMAYGADWLRLSNEDSKDEDCNDDVAASCSFYDHKAFIWT